MREDFVRAVRADAWRRLGVTLLPGGVVQAKHGGRGRPWDVLVMSGAHRGRVLFPTSTKVPVECGIVLWLPWCGGDPMTLACLFHYVSGRRDSVI